jgi:hypothetical protein
VGNETAFIAEAVCNPESRARAVDALVQDFHSAGWKKRVADAVGSAWIGSYLTIGSWRSGPFLGNWLGQARRVTDTDAHAHMHVVNVALDKGGMDGCENFRQSLPNGRFTLSCVSLVGWLPATLFEAQKDTEARRGSCESTMTLWTKPLILKAAVEASAHPILMVDTDVVIHKDMMTHGAKLMSGGMSQMIAGVEANGRVNTGTVFATRASLPVLQDWVNQSSSCLNSLEVDKSALQHILHYGSKGASLSTFPLTEVGQCDKSGSFATHYNCAGKRKAFVMKSQNNWVDSLSENAADIAQPGQLFNLNPKRA